MQGAILYHHRVMQPKKGDVAKCATLFTTAPINILEHIPSFQGIGFVQSEPGNFIV